MADDSQNQGTGTPPEDPIKNIKAEYDRKLDAVNAQIAEQNKFMMDQFNQIMNAVKKPAAPAQTDKELEKLAYDDPAKYADVVAKRATDAATEAAARITQANNERQAVLAQLTAEYPELADATSSMYQKVVQQSKSLGSNYSTSEIRSLIREVAADEGLLPKAKRPAATGGDFSLGGTRSGSQSRQSAQAKELDERTLQFAELMGMNVKDPKTVERLKQSANRKTWNRYRAPGGEE